MLGLLQWSEERGVSLRRAQLLGLPVLRAEVHRGGRWEQHRLGRAGRLLTRQGVRRVLVPREFADWNVLTRQGLAGVDPLPLYRAAADRLVLARLERRGVVVHRACVALRGEHVDADLARAARLLCPQVRALDIQVERGGERLARELYWEFGAALCSGEPADVAVRFGGPGQEGELVLCGAPELLGLTLAVRGAALPEGLEAIPLITALWQAGRLNVRQLCVVEHKIP